MKAIVEAITEIGEDVKGFEARPNLDVDVSRLESLKHESTTRLNNLMQAARNHAMASGLSPVSLLDAAAGHLSSNVVEIFKLLKIKRSDKKSRIDLRRSSLSIKDMVNRSNLSVNDGGAISMSRQASENGDRDREREREKERQKKMLPPINTSGASGKSTPMDNRPSSAASRSIPSTATTQMQGQQQTSYPTSAMSQMSLGTPTYSGTGNGNGNGSSHGNISINGNGGGSGPGQPLRVNSYQSVGSTSQRSDSFELDRKPSISSIATSDNKNGFGFNSVGSGGAGGGGVQNQARGMVQPPSRNGSLGPNHGGRGTEGVGGGFSGNDNGRSLRYDGNDGHQRNGSGSGPLSSSSASSSGPTTVEHGQSGAGIGPGVAHGVVDMGDGEDEKEWEDLKVSAVPGIYPCSLSRVNLHMRGVVVVRRIKRAHLAILSPHPQEQAFGSSRTSLPLSQISRYPVDTMTHTTHTDFSHT